MNIFANNLIFMAGHMLPAPIVYVIVKESTNDSTMASIVAIATIFVAFLIYKRMGVYGDTAKQDNER